MKFHNYTDIANIFWGKEACWRGFPVEVNLIDLVHSKLKYMSAGMSKTVI